ncbi:MAG: DUF4339 domain-containing protein [Candidatus Algichlamydia australiensis]|nr:DUF4339 domain-containing protein [Chlamydiales bacterium]
MMLLSFCGALFFGHMHKKIALYKGRNPNRWFWFGFFFGILGLPFIICAPKRGKKEVAPITKLPEHPLCQKMWYYLDKDRLQVGPMSFNAFVEAKAKGLFRDDSHVWCEGFENWKLLKELPDELKTFIVTS